MDKIKSIEYYFAKRTDQFYSVQHDRSILMIK